MTDVESAVKFALLYIAVISFFSAMLTILDKYLAVVHKWRVPENILLIFALLGGGVSEYVVMKMIRHKTQHKKFMIGLPIIILIHLAIIIIIELKIHNII